MNLPNQKKKMELSIRNSGHSKYRGMVMKPDKQNEKVGRPTTVHNLLFRAQHKAH